MKNESLNALFDARTCQVYQCKLATICLLVKEIVVIKTEFSDFLN